ncbi:MAG TPA: DHA2 family efflux MFS transporter permease subunit [Acidimicrobiales bacterium]|nr:DHA2 family efflux MFS transporter permease subunit [Acidimicrobiales bacterium]
MQIQYGTPAARWVLLATVLGSGMAMLDGTVVNVAVAPIGRDFGAEVSGLQWVLTAYLVTLSALLLIGGSLGDRFGRRRVFLVGAAWFTVASVACAAAPSLPVLVAARAVQGVGGALLVPGSLAIIEASFAPDDRGRAIGMWSGLGGVATAIGPLAGGWLVTAVSWRLIFLLNLPLAVMVAVAARHVPDSRDPSAAPRIDVAGASLVVVGLAAVAYALIDGPSPGADVAVAAVVGAVGVLALAGFVLVERRTRYPMLPLSVFSSRQFTAANLVTFAVYAALGGVLFLLAVDLQQVLGYSPLAAGAALLPITAIMLALSSRAGALAQRIGPRLPMTVGPLVMAVGLVLMVRIVPDSPYGADVLPAVVVFALGLASTVAPLTTTVLAAVDAAQAGLASGVNNAVARVAGLAAVAVLPPLAGLTGAAYRQPARFSGGFHTAVLVGAGLCAAGALCAVAGIRNPPPDRPAGPEPPAGGG